MAVRYCKKCGAPIAFGPIARRMGWETEHICPVEEAERAKKTKHYKRKKKKK